MILFSLLACLSMTVCAEEKALTVEVSNPVGEVRCDEPVVLDISRLGMDVRRAVVTDAGGNEIASQIDDTDHDWQNDQVCFLADLGKKRRRSIRSSCMMREARRSIPHAHSPNWCCRAVTRNLPRTSRISICAASPLTTRHVIPITMYIRTGFVSRATLLPCASTLTRGRR